MSVGGKIIEKDVIRSETDREVTRFLVIDGKDLTFVLSVPEVEEPEVGDSIWWQRGKIYWDNDKRTLIKVGYSYSPESRPC